MKTAKQYWKVIVPLLVVVLFFAIYFIGQCSGKRKNQPITNSIDTLKKYTEKVEKRNAVLLQEITKLKDKLRQDSIHIIEVEKQRQDANIQYAYLISKIKTLPLDSAVKLMAYNFTNKTPIITRIEAKDTLVSICPLQVKEVNNAFITSYMFKSDNEYLNNEIKLMISSDSNLVQILVKQEEMLNSKDNIITGNEQVNKELILSLNKVTKQYKHQRFWKYVFKGTSLFLLGYAALK